MSTSAPVSNLPKITSSNICWSRGFYAARQFSPSRFLSVSDLTRQANCKKPADCQVQQIDTSWGKKKSICADKRSPLHRQSGGARCIRDGQRRKLPVCRWKTNTSCQSNPTSESKWERMRSWPLASSGGITFSFLSHFRVPWCLPLNAVQGPLGLNTLLWPTLFHSQVDLKPLEPTT